MQNPSSCPADQRATGEGYEINSNLLACWLNSGSALARQLATVFSRATSPALSLSSLGSLQKEYTFCSAQLPYMVEGSDLA